MTETLSKVQMSAEDYFASIRRTVFDFDEVLNSQRRTLYRVRDSVLSADAQATEEIVARYSAETIAEIVPNFLKKGLDAAGNRK